MRTYRPTTSGFASQHSKQWLIDDKVLLTGSVNLSHGGFDHNCENLVVLKDSAEVAKALAFFHELWALGTEVTEARLRTVVARQEAAKEKARENAKKKALSRPARSKSLSRLHSTDALEDDPEDAQDQ